MLRVTIDGEDDLAGLRRAGRAVAEAREAMSAQFEHTIVVTKGAPLILTAAVHGAVVATQDDDFAGLPGVDVLAV